MTRKSKYATLDRAILHAIALRPGRSHRSIYVNAGRVRRALYAHNPLKLPYYVWRVLSRRLQALKRRGLIRCGAWDRWYPV